MEKETIINGRYFEVLSKPTKRVISILRNVSHPWNPWQEEAYTIYQAYNKPSSRKIGIYKDWCSFFYGMEADLFKMVIPTHNSQIFTIAVRMDDKLFYITPTHNYLIPLTRELLDNIPHWKCCDIFAGL